MLVAARASAGRRPRVGARRDRGRAPRARRAKGWKPGDLFTPLRTAVTGAKVSPPLFETMHLLGRETTLARLQTD